MSNSYDLMDYSQLGSSVYEIFQARILESESDSVMSDSLRPHELYSPCNSPGQNSGVGCHFLLQGIFLTQRLNLDLLQCRADSLPTEKVSMCENLTFDSLIFFLFLYTLNYNIIIKYIYRYDLREKADSFIHLYPMVLSTKGEQYCGVAWEKALSFFKPLHWIR